jgi:hypothetical protein
MFLKIFRPVHQIFRPFGSHLTPRIYPVPYSKSGVRALPHIELARIGRCIYTKIENMIISTSVDTSILSNITIGPFNIKIKY